MEGEHRQTAAWLVMAATMMGSACESIETTPEAASGDVSALVSGDGRVRGARGLGPELYGPGSSWYAYDSTTHALTPRPIVYVIRRGEGITLLEIESYYDARGESGTFTLRALHHDGERWRDAVVERTLSRSIKSGATICVSERLDEVDCDQGLVVFRSSWRPLPEAGFAVQEPGFYARSHYSAPPDEQVHIAAIEARSIEQVDREDLDTLRSIAPLADASATPHDSRVGPIEDASRWGEVYLHVTATMHAAQWRIKSVEGQDQGDTVVTMGVRCQTLNLADQQPFDTREREVVWTLPGGDDGSYRAVRGVLCGPDQGAATTLTQPASGLWPDTKTFDFFLERYQGVLSIIAAPSSLVLNHTLSTGERGDQATISLTDLSAEGP